jgi:hypothetical protein
MLVGMADNRVRCPHGIECDYVYRTQYFHGHGDIVVGGDYWHDEDTRCALSNTPADPHQWVRR